MDNSRSNQQSTSQGDGAGTSGRYGWLDDYQAGNYDNLPHDEIYSSYRDWSRDANPDEVYQATFQGYQGLPQDQWQDVATDLHGYSQQRGLDLSDLELSSPDYQQWNAQDLARVTGRAYGYSGREEKEEKDKDKGGVPKPIIGLALAGALAFGASKLMGGKGDKEKETERSYGTNMERTTTSTDYTSGAGSYASSDRGSYAADTGSGTGSGAYTSDAGSSDDQSWRSTSG